MMNVKYLALVIMLFLFSGCATRMIDFTVISSKNAMIEYEKRNPERTKGVASGLQILGIPLAQPHLKEAVDRAIENADSQYYDALIDGVIYKKYKWFVLFGLNQYIVEGTPIQTRSLDNATLMRLEKEGRIHYLD